MSGLAEERGGKKAKTPKVSAARRAAFDVLMLVGMERGHSDDLLHGRHMAGLLAADKNLAVALVMGVLRWQIALDARVRGFLSKPDAALAPEVAIALRLGAFQLLHMDRIPAHAALSESVELVRAAGQEWACGMVNAVLRKVAAAPTPGQKLHESTAAFAERLGHPVWLAERWVKNYGRAGALTICEGGQREPACGALFADEEDGAAMPAMDDGSRLVAELAAAAMPEAQRVWDCCAAPGGKTLVLARRLAGAAVLATDASPRRLKGLQERLAAEGGERVETRLHDATAALEDEDGFDLILCDVPCTGTGTMARNPEIRQRLVPAEISRQARRQAGILRAAWAKLRVGGRLVYATCSLEPEECERVVAVLGGADVARVDALPLLRNVRVRGGVGFDGAVRDGALRTLPGTPFEGDGFFAQVLEKGRA